MADAIKPVSAGSYTVKYRDTASGEMKTLRRSIPAKMHNGFPGDKVELLKRRNEDFDEGEKYEIKTLGPRSPNILQLKKDDGQTTFVSFLDVNVERVAPGEKAAAAPRSKQDRPEDNRYLLWP